MEKSVEVILNKFEEEVGMPFNSEEREFIEKEICLHSCCYQANVIDYAETKEDCYDPENTFEVAVYGDKVNVAIECTRCNSVIVDKDFV